MQAQRSGICDRIVVSTDSVAIAEVATDHGGEVPFFRPAELATDTAAHIFIGPACANVVEGNEDLQPGLVILLQPHEPLPNAGGYSRRL